MLRHTLNSRYIKFPILKFSIQVVVQIIVVTVLNYILNCKSMLPEDVMLYQEYGSTSKPVCATALTSSVDFRKQGTTRTLNIVIKNLSYESTLLYGSFFKDVK